MPSPNPIDMKEYLERKLGERLDRSPAGVAPLAEVIDMLEALRAMVAAAKEKRDA